MNSVGGRRPGTFWARLATAFGGGALLLSGPYAVASALMARGLLRTRRLPLHDTPDAVGLDWQDAEFPSRGDGVRLSGWLIRPASGNSWIVIVHGFGAHRADPATGQLGLARDLWCAGFGVLLFDLRGCGRSAGRTGSVGYFERYDLLGALDYLNSVAGPDRTIGVVGFSLGGVVALTACASGEAGVAAVVADSAFSSLRAVMSRGGAGRLLAVFHPGMRYVARHVYGVDVDGIDARAAMRMARVPVLIVHGGADHLVPVSHARVIAGARSTGGTDPWVLTGAGHAQAYRTARAAYVARVAAFMESAMAA